MQAIWLWASSTLIFLVGHLPSPVRLSSPSVVANRANTSRNGVSSGGTRTSHTMAPRIGPIPACMPLSTPDERRWVAIPANDGIGKPLLKDFHIIGMIPLQRSTFDD